MATDPRKLYKLLIVSTGQSGQGMSHYHYGEIVLVMPGLDHILLLRKCVLFTSDLSQQNFCEL